MKNHLQKLALFLMCATCFLFVSAQKTEPWDLPVNSKSEKAVALFQQGIQAMNDVNFVKSTSSFNEALEEDPTFFMPYCMLATFNLYFGNTDEFKSLAQKAIAIKKLPKHEAIMQDALKKLLEDPESDLSEMGNQLVKMYPKSLAAHQMLSTYQSINNNVEGVLQTNLAMLDLTDNDAPIYNMLGYSYMNLGKMDKAKEAFETYIKLASENPNVYDSMGDYFMAAKEYDNAYKNFMKAHEINDAWSYNKAMKAKELMEKDEVMAVIEKETAAYYANDLAKWAETYSQDTNIYILGAGKDGYGITSGWNNYYTSAKSFFPGQVIQNNEVKTPIRIKVYDNSAWVVFNNKSPNDEFLATCFLEKVDDQWKIVYRSRVNTSTYFQPDIFLITAINFAKSNGKSAEELGTFTSNMAKESYNPQLSLGGLANNVRSNWGIFVNQDNMKTIEEDENHVVLQFTDFLNNLKNNGPIYNVSYSDYISFFNEVFKGIADHLGYVYAQETVPNGVEITITKK